MHERTISPTTSAVTFVVLVVLTVSTVSLSLVPMGPAGHLAVGLAFGVAKAGLVALIFMHLIRSPVRVWVAAGVGLFWLGILISLIMTDYLARSRTSF